MRSAALNITRGDSLADDLLSECILVFLEKPQAQQITDSGGSLYYLIKIMTNQWKSSTSPFHKQYRRTTHLETDKIKDVPDDIYIQEDDIASKLAQDLDALEWYPKSLFTMNAINGESVSSISRATKIPRASITVEVKRVRKYLKQKSQGYID